MTRRILVFAFLLQAVLWWRVIAWSPELPERFPTHFNFRGEPDGWSTSRVVWFLLPMISLGVLLLFGAILVWIESLARKAPGIMNIPRKDVFLKLSPEGRVSVLGPTRAFLAWMMLLITGLFMYIVEGSARVAVGRDATLPSWPVFVFLGLVFSTLPVFIVATMREVDRRALAEGVTTSGADARRGR